jgi:hypothetical protein
VARGVGSPRRVGKLELEVSHAMDATLMWATQPQV